MDKKKPEYVAIVSIIAGNEDGRTIYGLGDDNMVYFWIAGDNVWQLYG